MRKNKKKGKGKWEKGKAISQRWYVVDDAVKWSVECGGTIIELGATTKKWIVGALGWIGFTRSIDSTN